MSIEIVVRPQDATKQTSPTPALPTLAEVAEQVRRDSQRDADSYLEQTVVPHGGE